jgi:hypothetical protein
MNKSVAHEMHLRSVCKVQAAGTNKYVKNLLRDESVYEV